MQTGSFSIADNAVTLFIVSDSNEGFHIRVTDPRIYGRVEGDSVGTYELGDVADWLSQLGYAPLGAEPFVGSISTIKVNATVAAKDEMQCINDYCFLVFTAADGREYYIAGMEIQVTRDYEE